MASGKSSISSAQRSHSEREVGAENRASAERSLRREIDEDRSRGRHNPGHDAHDERERRAAAAARDEGGESAAVAAEGETTTDARSEESFGHVVARQIAGDRANDAALSGLLSELKDLGDDNGAKRSRTMAKPTSMGAQPAVPAKTEGSEDVVNRAASAYQTNQKTIGGKDKFRPGMVFSERF